MPPHRRFSPPMGFPSPWELSYNKYSPAASPAGSTTSSGMSGNARVVPVRIEGASPGATIRDSGPPSHIRESVREPVRVETTNTNTNTTTAQHNGAGAAARGMMERNRSIDDFNEQIVNVLDEVERRVEQLRETAGLLEQEKESIIDLLSSFNLNSELLRLGQGDREDINATSNRLLARAKAVEVVVGTPRNEEQQKALQQVNSLIDGVLQKMADDLDTSKEQCRRFLNACSPDQPEGPIDQRFQAQVIECTADDQKKIRRKLAQIITQIERAERTCMPQW